MPTDPPLAPTRAQLTALLAHVVRAPSVLNSQPWRFEVDGGTVRLLADRSRQLPALDPEGRELTLSCGAALAYLRIAAAHAGWAAEVLPLPDPDAPDLLATVTFRPAARPAADDRLFRALAERHTNRLDFTDEPVPPDAADAMRAAAAACGATLHVFEHADERATIARLVSQGVVVQGEDAAVMADVRRWLRPAGDPRPDGVPDRAQGLWDRTAVRRVPAAAVARHKAELVLAAPAVLVLATATDGPSEWLAAGQALAWALVVAADHGLAASYMNEPVEVAALRPHVAALCGGGAPQVVFRVGYPEAAPSTARRYVSDVTAPTRPDDRR